MKLNGQLQSIFDLAFERAQNRRHGFFTPEHLLFAALDTPKYRELIELAGGDPDAIKESLDEYLKKEIPLVAGGKPVQTVMMQAVMERASFHCASSQKAFLDVSDVIVSLFDEQKTQGSFLLRKFGVDRLRLLEAVSFSDYSGEDDFHGDLLSAMLEEAEDFMSAEENALLDDDGLITQKTSAEHNAPLSPADKSADGTRNEKKKSYLERFTENLTAKALSGIDPAIGREDEIERTIGVLCRRLKNNPLFVGEAGVGKTALAGALAFRIAHNDVPPSLQNCSVYSLEMSSVIAGTKYRGDFEDRLKHIIDEVMRSEKNVLFIDEIHTIIGAGSVSGGTLDAANMLKPVLTSGKIRVIGSTTFEDYKRTFEKDRTLARRFQKITIAEPSTEETVKILRALKTKYEAYHGVLYADESLKAAVNLSVRFLPELRLPDKAIDIMDEAGAAVKILHAAKTKSAESIAHNADVPAQAAVKIPLVKTTHVERVTSKMARVPLRTIASKERDKLRTLEADIKTEIFGQDNAARLIAQTVKRARAGFRNADKSAGAFLFVGPTGVGKTELARTLAKKLALNLIRFDMSEYQEKHSVSRLIGAPPGYVGFEDGGLLTDSVRKEPNSIVLFDEIEKAHADIFNVLLQVMDYGTLTDNQGRKADFHNCMLIMTSNAGVRESSRMFIGFGGEEEGSGAVMKAVEKIFPPEFRNRLDAVVPFAHLGKDIIEKIVYKEIALLEARLKTRKVKLLVSPDCVDFLAAAGYSKEFGARNISRVIDEKISSPLVDEVLFGALSRGGTVNFVLENGAIKAEYH